MKSVHLSVASVVVVLGAMAASAAPLPVAGFRNALAFVGIKGYVEVADAPNLNFSTSYSIEAWIRPHQFASGAGMVSKNTSVSDTGYILCLGTTPPYSGVSFDQMETKNGLLASNRWCHVAAVNDNGTRHVYIDGVERSVAGEPKTVKANTLPLLIGIDGVSSANFFDGEMDEVRVWNTALTVTNIAAWMYRELDSTHPAYSSLVAYYKLNEGSGTNAADSAGNDNPGTLQNTPEVSWLASSVRDWYVVEPSRCVTGQLVGSWAVGSSYNGYDWALKFKLLTQPAFGTVDILQDNIFLYTATSSNSANDIFLYRVSEPLGGESLAATATVTLVMFTPYVDITNTVNTVPGSTTSISVGGTNNEYVVGTLWWTNSANGACGTQPAAASWAITNIALAPGDNVIAVNGSNQWGTVVGDSLPVYRNAAHDGSSPIHYVATNGIAIWPYTNWSTAARDIQRAVDAAVASDTVLVSDGVYRVTTQIVVTNGITMASVRGADSTVLLGGFPASTNRCLFITGNSVVDGFTVTNGYTVNESGGGVYCAAAGIVRRIVARNNQAVLNGSGVYPCGGGICCDVGGTAEYCIVQYNYAGHEGGGIYCGANALARSSLVSGNTAGGAGDGMQASFGGIIENCTVVANTGYGISVYNGGAIRNTIAWFNTVGGISGGSIMFSCAPGLVLNSGNITNYPQFVNTGAGNYRLAFSSPCINAGTNLPGMESLLDLDGKARIIGIRADMGAFEFPLPGVVATSAPATVSYDITAMTIAGTNNPFVVGSMTWSNTAASAGGSLPATNAWQIGGVPLAVGSNTVTVVGTNEFGQQSSSSVVLFRGGPGTGTPVVDITNTSFSVSGATTAATIGGTNNMQVVGMLWWSNAATQAGGSFPASSSWSIASIALALRDNTITVFGTNLWNVQGSDSITITRTPLHTGVSPIHYVATNGAAIWPYTNWAMAATVIQDAVDTAYTNDLVLVTNGVYATGGAVPAGSTLTSRLVVAKALTVQSVHGPSFTTIQGGGSGLGAVRGVYLAAGATLAGFTVTNGGTLASGIVNNDRSGGGVFLDRGGVVTNCWLVGNNADRYGGGVFCSSGGILLNCTIQGNSAGMNGGGVYCSRGGTLKNCLVMANSASTGGGGVYCSNPGGSLQNCIISGNTATAISDGGGVFCYYGGSFQNCAINNNTSSSEGGGAFCYGGGSFQSCTISGNSAPNAGGVYCFLGGSFQNCTLSSNTASNNGGGGYCNSGGSFTNCILQFNTAASGSNYHRVSGGVFAWSCTTPNPGGLGNITNSPQFVSFTANNFRLAPSSPCINTGTNLPGMQAQTDLDGRPRIIGARVDMGAFEYPIPAVVITTMPATVAYAMTSMVIAGTNSPYVVGGMIWSNTEANASGPLSAAPAWQIPVVPLVFGSNSVTVIGTNEYGHPASSSVQITRRGPDAGTPVHYVDPGGGNAWPYTNWSMAATCIQDAVDAAWSNDLVLVNNGVYATGGALTPGAEQATTSRVVVAKAVMVCSVNGPAATTIAGWGPGGTNGAGAVRGVFLANGAVLSGFTVSGGCTQVTGNWLTDQSGGGVLINGGGSVSNCIVTGNKAVSGGGIYCSTGAVTCSTIALNSAAMQGGGAYLNWFSSMDRCVVSNNTCAVSGGGVYSFFDCSVTRCVIVGNTAQNGGGAIFYGGTHCDNSLIYANVASNQGGGVYVTYDSSILNTVISSNRADTGGGVYCYLGGKGPKVMLGGTFTNCILQFNTAVQGSNYFRFGGGGVFAWSCTSPDPDGPGNITGNPQFVNAGAGNFRLAPSSLCINTGTNLPGLDAQTDLGGMPRIIGPFADMGAFEFPVPCVVITTEPATVSHDITAVAIAGTNNPYVVGSMVWSNQDAAAGGVMPATNAWVVYDVPLAVGSNCVTVIGTNVFGQQSSSEVVLFRGGTGSGIPVVDITNTPFTVPGNTTAVAIGGTNNENVVGMMKWSNPAAQSSGPLPAAAQWSITNIPLVLGDNTVSVSGTNSLDVLTNDSIVITRNPVDTGVSPVHYVATNGAAIWPYTNWATAATMIQIAVDAADTNDLVLVNNGVYDTGSSVLPGASTGNRVVIAKPITVQSVQGPAFTAILGWGPGNDNGFGAIRGVFLAEGAMLSGFTVSNGCTVTSSPVPEDISGGGVFISFSGTVSNCWLLGNHANMCGAGVYADQGGLLIHCIVSGNGGVTGLGGGAYLNLTASMRDCLVSGNVGGFGGGVYAYGDVSLLNCTVSRNIADSGAGLYIDGGDGSFANCFFSDNVADSNGGGIFRLGAGPLVNCTVSRNTAYTGGGVYSTSGSQLRNCIVQANSATISNNYYRTSFSWSCTTPLPTGVGNITNDPLFVNSSNANYRLSANSPCINTGTNLPGMATQTDLDGVPRILFSTVDMGAYEYTGPWIAPDTLIFPSAGSTLELCSTNIVWNPLGIQDYPDGTNLLITRITACDAVTNAPVVPAVSNAWNPSGRAAWTPHVCLLDVTSCVLRFEVIDSASNTATRVFTNHVFTVIPEPVLPLLLLLVLCRRHRCRPGSSP